MTFCDPADVKLLVLDVDGVMTAGEVVVDETGATAYHFNVQDGSAIKYWHRCGGKTAIITGRSSAAVQARADQLEIEWVYQAALKKLDAFRQCLADTGISADQTCCVGDDLPDIPVMQSCGYPVAVANAVAEVKQLAAYVTCSPGGAGAVREVIEVLLRARGDWSKILQGYYNQRL
jgi:3-deoxy-D-manno-octulosonate 8-phosphate phosphatase (KDO 8-P phosphatase)